MAIHCKTRMAVHSSEAAISEAALSEPVPCSIENYIAEKDPFRVTRTNRIPLSWPFTLKIEKGEARMDRDKAFHGTLEPGVREILKEFGIKVGTIHVHRIHPQGFPDAEEDIIVIMTPDTTTGRWQEAVESIFKMVSDAAAQSGTRMGVMLENHDLSYSDISIAVRPRPEVLGILSALLAVEPVVDIAVKENCAGLWTSIAYHFRRHKCHGGDPFPTVIVFVTPGSVAPWGDVEVRIRNAIEAVAFDFDVELGLEILPGFSSPTTAPSSEVLTTRRTPRLQLKIPQVPTVGSSISPQLSDTDSGTMGVVVNFQPPGRKPPQKCFLTTYHAIAAGDPVGRAQNDKFGIALHGRAVDRRIEITSPAICDAEYSKERLARLAAGYENTDNRYYSVLTHIIEHEGVIGDVIHASGLQFLDDRVDDGRCRVDWALVALHPSKSTVVNALPPCPVFQPLCADEPEFVNYYSNVRFGDVVTGVAAIHALCWVGRIYNRQAATAGRPNLMTRTVCWDDGHVSKEVEAIAFFGDFSSGGDDGAMVFNERKQWIGMVIGGDSEHAGFITPAAVIISDIENRTGGTITLI